MQELLIFFSGIYKNFEDMPKMNIIISFFFFKKIKLKLGKMPKYKWIIGVSICIQTIKLKNKFGTLKTDHLNNP